MKKFLCLFLMIVFCFTFFTGCGNETTSNSEASTQTGNDTTAATTTQSEPKQEEPVSLNFLLPGKAKTDGEDFFSGTIPRLVKEKFPNITVNTEQLPDEQFKTTLKARLASGEGPDFYMYWAGMGLTELAKAGYAKDVSAYDALKQFNQGVVKSFTDDNKVYALPQGVVVLGTYFNKELFNKAGIESIPQDWNSFLDACKKLKAAGTVPMVMGDKDSWVIQFGLYQIAANVFGEGFLDYDGKMLTGEKHFNDAEWTKAVSMYNQLYKDGYMMKNSLGIGSAQAAQLFIDGKAAMIIDGSWAYDGLMKKGAIDFERGFFALPANETGNQVVHSYSPGAGIVINPDTKYSDTVDSLINYWLEKDSPLYQAWRKSTPDLPAISGESYDKKELSDFITKFQASPAVPFCNNNWPSGVADELTAKFQGLIAGRGTPEDITKDIETKLRDVQKQAAGN